MSMRAARVRLPDGDLQAVMPQARQTGLLIEELPDEVLVYDLERHRATCLNRAAALVWKHCDGQTSVTRVACLLHDDLGLPADAEVVRLAVAQLDKARLLDGPSMAPEERQRYSRRQVIRRLALIGGALALPAAISLLTPPAIAHASHGTCLHLGQTGCPTIPCCAGCQCTGAAPKTCTGGPC